jgi:hypothetical protein
MTCTQSKNLLCKHVRAERTYYLDLDDYLPAGVTISNPTAESADTNLGIDAIAVVDEDTLIEGSGNCPELTLRAGRAVLVLLSAGTVTEQDEETLITVGWDQSDVDNDFIDVRLIIGGTPSA